MPKRTLALTTSMVLALGPLAPCAERDAKLDRGIKQVEAGEWEQGLATLNDVAQRLSGDKNRRGEAAEAHLYSGLAYVGLGDTVAAIAEFTQARRRDPSIQIPERLATRPALDAFDVAKREAAVPEAEVKAQAKKAGKKKPLLPFIAGGVGLAVAGVAVAAGGDGAEGAADRIPTTFTVTGRTGSPQLTLVSAVPASASTINIRQTAPVLSFTFNNEATLPSRVQIVVDLHSASGNCMVGRSEVAAVDRGLATIALVVNSWNITCAGAFISMGMTARIMDADANIPVSVTTYAGGYIFTTR